MIDLPDTMRAIQQDETGGPLRVAEIPLPRPGPGEVLVRINASPINPSDLMMLQGEYGTSFAYPMTPGLEGAGEVLAAGPGLLPRYLKGRRVACAGSRQGLWAEYAAVPATQCLPMPADVPLEAGAMAVVNPLTAYAFGEYIQKTGHRSVISTGAAGQLGAMIRKTCAAKGVTVINVVRSEAQRARLEAEGAVALDMTSDSFDADLTAACKTHKCRLALDAVAGEMTYRLAEAMPKRSEILLYGALSLKASRLHPGTMIFKEITVRGFWLTQWFGTKSMLQLMRISGRVMNGLKGGFAMSEVARRVSLDETPGAPEAYAADMSAGKWLIMPNGPQESGV